MTITVASFYKKDEIFSRSNMKKREIEAEEGGKKSFFFLKKK